MQAMQEYTMSSASESREPIRAWIESRDGAIVRGVVDVLAEDGAVILLADSDAIDAGDAVTVRLSFDRAAPTLASGALVLSIRAGEDASECEVEWLPGPDGSRLASLVASLG